MDVKRRDRIAQWAYDTRPILGRFHLWLDDVDHRVLVGDGENGSPSFVGPALERAMVVAAAVTALGTRLFGRYGEGRGQDKAGINRVKKDADAVSAYALSEALWYLSRNLPEGHAILVSLGEGLMPKAGETPEMGSNPLLGFGRVYARPQVARFLDRRVHRLINDPEYGWDGFWGEVQERGLTVWGAAIDTLENTSRFAKGSPSGPMTILHLFDQPLAVVAPYEGYVGTLVLPREVVERAARRSLLLSYRTPRSLVLEALAEVYPDVPRERVHVWTLGGASRQERLGRLWEEWRQLGAHVVEDGWPVPGGGPAFTESGTYAPMSRVGPFTDDRGDRHLFLCDGYAASAEAIQGASLDPILGTHTAMCLFSSRFAAPHDREREVMALDPESPGFDEALAEALGEAYRPELVAGYRRSIVEARRAGLPVELPILSVDDFFPAKQWRVLAVAGYMLPDPYSGCPGVEEAGPDRWRVTVRAATKQRVTESCLTLRLMEPLAESRLVFLPLLDRFYAGEDWRSRPVKISDSGRIRNELQTLASEALEHFGEGGVRVRFDRIEPEVLPPDKQRLIRQVLEWYKENHPIWFRWLDIAG
ncbi:MAG TPA: hypothetical protein VMT16_07165 [Thermoanaerobaculia bacterium]|nr:hypothetical protein [Thermoanaerobaculia bacterium]